MKRFIALNSWPALFSLFALIAHDPGMQRGHEVPEAGTTCMGTPQMD